MLSFFQKATLTQYLLGFLFIAICWIPTFFLVPVEKVAEEVLQYDSILKAGFSNVYALNALALVITLISALILNHLTTEFGLTGKLMTMGVFFFGILSISISSFTVMNPYIFINFFLFFFIRNLFRLPDVENPIPLLFNASLMLSIASFYFFNIIFLFIVIWIALMMHRTNSWRNYVSSIIGLILPYLFILTWYFWSDQLQDYMLIFTKKSYFEFKSLSSLRIPDLIILLPITFFLIIAILKTYTSLGEKNISLRRNLIISIYYLIVSVIIFVLFAPELNAALIIIVPASLIMANAYSDLRNYKWYNISFSILLVLIIVNQYLKFFF